VSQHRKKLIEVALPLEAINVASAREKSIRHGHPSTLHIWWARRPLAAARAVIFAQMVDDPSAHPERFPTEEAQDAERQRLFRLIEQLVLWENTANETLLAQARAEIWQSWRDTCTDHQDDLRAAELYNPDKLPAFHDPFAGGGSIPLEAQRLGLEAYASDLNPVAVLINKAMIEIPPKFAGQPPVNPEDRKRGMGSAWKGAAGLAADVRHYGTWMRDEAEQRIDYLYPKIEISAEMAQGRPDLKPLVGHKLTVIAWLWARTVKSPNPAFAQMDVPLASSFILATKPGKEAYIDPIVEPGGYRFTVRLGKPRDPTTSKSGTKLSRGANFACLMSGTPISADYLMGEGQAGRMGARLMAVVALGERGRIYLPPTGEMEAVARDAKPYWRPDVEFFQQALGFRIGNYGITMWSALFTARQLVALTTLADLVQEARERIKYDALIAGLPNDGQSLDTGGTTASAYADAVSVYLGLAASKAADNNSTMCSWMPGVKYEVVRNTFSRQALPMSWDYAESNPFAQSSGDFFEQVRRALAVFDIALVADGAVGQSTQAVAQIGGGSAGRVVSTDPPYYDNVGFADLSDFFYVWLRRSLRSIFPDLFTTVAVPKADELVGQLTWY
jgi:putative DNA methylase